MGKDKVIIGLMVLLSIITIFIFVISDKKDNENSIDSESNGFYMKISRHACYGTCPVYELELDSNGSIAFLGKQYVKTEGIRNSRISKEDIEKIKDKIRDVGFFDLDKEYIPPITDSPGVIVYLRLDGRDWSVYNYANANDKVNELEGFVNKIVGIEQWLN